MAIKKSRRRIRRVPSRSGVSDANLRDLIYVEYFIVVSAERPERISTTFLESRNNLKTFRNAFVAPRRRGKQMVWLACLLRRNETDNVATWFTTRRCIVHYVSRFQNNVYFSWNIIAAAFAPRNVYENRFTRSFRVFAHFVRYNNSWNMHVTQRGPCRSNTIVSYVPGNASTVNGLWFSSWLSKKKKRKIGRAKKYSRNPSKQTFGARNYHNTQKRVCFLRIDSTEIILRFELRTVKAVKFYIEKKTSIHCEQIK